MVWKVIKLPLIVQFTPGGNGFFCEACGDTDPGELCSGCELCRSCCTC